MSKAQTKYLKEVSPLYMVINPKTEPSAAQALAELTELHGSKAQAVKRALIVAAEINRQNNVK